jgi:hypothetical protein
MKGRSYPTGCRQSGRKIQYFQALTLSAQQMRLTSLVNIGNAGTFACKHPVILGGRDSRALGETVSEPINIRKIIEELIAGRMRVPNFQRGFVWDPERVAYLMDKDAVYDKVRLARSSSNGFLIARDKRIMYIPSGEVKSISLIDPVDDNKP